MIIIALPNSLTELVNILDSSTQWCYLGKDISKRFKISDVIGDQKRFFLKDKLHMIVKKMREPFIDYVARIGTIQKNELIWWASRFASRSPFQTDFFLLFCYRILVDELIKDDRRDSKLVIFVEDPWLFEQIRSDYVRRGNTAIVFLGKTRLYRKRILALLRGIIYRMLFFGYVTILKLIIGFYYRNHKPAVAHGADSNTVAILSWIDERAFEKDSRTFRDSYTGGLAHYLQSQNIKVICPTYLTFPLKFVTDVVRNKNIIWPIILDLPLLRALLLLTKICNFKLETHYSSFEGYSLIFLFKREFWEEFRSPSFNMHLMYFYTIKIFFSRGWCDIFHYPFENQPFEKIICMAAKLYPEIKLIGYRDSTTSLKYLNMFLGKLEKDNVPLPHRIITIGQISQDLFVRHGNYPEGMFVNGGAWRYVHLHKKEVTIEEKSVDRTVLVATPIDKDISKTIIMDLKRSFYDTQAVKFIIKCHPATPFSSLGIILVNNGLFTVTDETTDSLIGKIDTVIYTACTVGVEYFVKGKKVIKYVMENILDLDQMEGVPEDLYFTCYEGDCFDGILNAVKTQVSRDKRQRMVEFKSVFFGHVLPEVWLQEINKT